MRAAASLGTFFHSYRFFFAAEMSVVTGSTSKVDSTGTSFAPLKFDGVQYVVSGEQAAFPVTSAGPLSLLAATEEKNGALQSEVLQLGFFPTNNAPTPQSPLAPPSGTGISFDETTLAVSNLVFNVKGSWTLIPIPETPGGAPPGVGPIPPPAVTDVRVFSRVPGSIPGTPAPVSFSQSGYIFNPFNGANGKPLLTTGPGMTGVQRVQLGGVIDPTPGWQNAVPCIQTPGQSYQPQQTYAPGASTPGTGMFVVPFVLIGNTYPPPPSSGGPGPPGPGYSGPGVVPMQTVIGVDSTTGSIAFAWKLAGTAGLCNWGAQNTYGGTQFPILAMAGGSIGSNALTNPLYGYAFTFTDGSL